MINAKSFSGLAFSLVILLAGIAVPQSSWSQDGESGAVTGQVTITRNLAAQRMRFRLYPSYKPIAPPPEASRSDEFQNVVIYLQPLNFDPPPLSSGVELDILQQGETFIPHVLPVTVGTTVGFPNLDPIFHNVFSLSRPSTFDLGRFPQHETRTVTFDKPGVVPVFCHLHSDMSAVVVVLDTPWYTIPAADGQYLIPDLPAGDYRVTAWHERFDSVQLEVSIAEGERINLDLSIPCLKRINKEHDDMKHRDTIMTFRALAAVLFLGLTGLAHAQQRFLVEGLFTGEVYDTSSDSLLLTRNDGDLSSVARLQLWSAYQLSDNWQIYGLVELEADDASGSWGSEFEVEQLAVRYTRPEAPYIVVEAGRILGPISVFANWHLSDQNPLIGELDTHPTTYPEGIQVSGSHKKFDYRVAYIDQPDFYADDEELEPDSAFRPVVGVGYSPFLGLRLGASWTEGPFLSRFYDDFLPEDVSWRDFDQSVIGFDFKYSKGYLELNGEWSQKEYQLPFLDPDLEEINYFVELKYTITPRLYAAARLQVLDRSLIGETEPEFTTFINRKLEDVEVGLGYRVNPDLLLKLSYRHHHWSSPDNEANGLNDGHSVAFQLSWFLDPRSWRRND